MSKNYSKAKAKENICRIVFYVFTGFWCLLVLLVGVSNRDYVLHHYMLTICLPVGGMSALIVALRAYFRGYGFVMSCLWGLLGFCTSLVPVWILRYINSTHYSLFIPAILGITIIYILISHFTDYRSDSKSDNQLVNEMMDNSDIKSTLLEPLYFTFKQKSFRFKGSKFGLLDDVNNQVRSISGESVLHYILWSIMVGMLVMEMVLFSPKLLNYNNPDMDNLRKTPTQVVDQIQNEAK